MQRIRVFLACSAVAAATVAQAAPLPEPTPTPPPIRWVRVDAGSTSFSGRVVVASSSSSGVLVTCKPDKKFLTYDPRRAHKIDAICDDPLSGTVSPDGKVAALVIPTEAVHYADAFVVADPNVKAALFKSNQAAFTSSETSKIHAVRVIDLGSGKDLSAYSVKRLTTSGQINAFSIGQLKGSISQP